MAGGVHHAAGVAAAVIGVERQFEQVLNARYLEREEFKKAGPLIRAQVFDEKDPKRKAELLLRGGMLLSYGLHKEAGEIFARLIDKGALLLEHGPLLYAVDRQGNEAKFWLDDFLQAMRVPDTSTSSKVVAEVLEQISEEIDDPQEQVRFKDEVMSLCKTEPELSPRQMGSMAERYVGSEEVGRLFDNLCASYSESHRKYHTLESGLKQLTLGVTALAVPEKFDGMEADRKSVV